MIQDSFIEAEQMIQVDVDIVEYDNLFKILLDIPGFQKQNLQITYANGKLSVSGRRVFGKKAEGDYIVRQIASKIFFESIYFHHGNINPDTLSARLSDDGYLLILVEKYKAKSPYCVRAIEID